MPRKPLNQPTDMFFKPAILITSALATLAVATPTRRTEPTPVPASSCNTGPVQCCNSVGKASDPSSAVILGLLGIVLQDLNVLVGIQCSPITVIGAGGASCSANPVCCKDNSHSLISISCIPVNLNL